VISSFVRKGGSGKTTIAVNLALQMSLCGFRTLLIDNDSQGDATSALGYDPDLLPEELSELGIPEDRAVTGHFGNLLGLNKICPYMSLESIVKKPFGENGPHLIPAEESLDDLEVALAASPNQDFRYAGFLHKARSGAIEGADLSQYEIIIIDNPPADSLLTRNAMVASDVLLCPVRIDRFSKRALSRLSSKLKSFEDNYDRSPEIIAVPTMTARGRPRMIASLAKLRAEFPGKVVAGELYSSDDYYKALEVPLPVIAWKGASENSVGALREVFAEIIVRVKSIAEN
jgi:cellulose biosynthesis protein BcsQ